MADHDDLLRERDTVRAEYVKLGNEIERLSEELAQTQYRRDLCDRQLEEIGRLIDCELYRDDDDNDESPAIVTT